MDKRIKPITDERMQLLATEIEKLVYVKSLADAHKLGCLIRFELDRAYRKGLVTGLQHKQLSKGDQTC